MKFQTIVLISAMLAISHSTPTPKKENAPQACQAASVASNATAKGTIAEGAKAGNVTATGGATGNVTAATGNATATAGSVVLPDGRIQQNVLTTDFNVLASVFKSAVVKGDGLLFSDLIQFPTDIGQSIFDKATNTKPFTITINDKSIFTPQGQAPLDTVRRADLLPSIRSTLNNVATTGVKTMHFSLQQDAAKPLNLTHDYQLMFLESADFATHQFDVRVGKVVDDVTSDGTQIVVHGNSKNAAGVQTLFSAPFAGVAGFQNFGLKMDFDANTMQVFHSVGDAPLAQVTEALPNDMSGNGEYHFAVLKNAIGTEPQPAITGEGCSFGGIFMEDSAGGFVSLQ